MHLNVEYEIFTQSSSNISYLMARLASSYVFVVKLRLLTVSTEETIFYVIVSF
jgi:hypothetical protein